MSEKETTLLSLGILVLSTTALDVVLAKNGRYVKYPKYCFDSWHHDNVINDIVDKFKDIGINTTKSKIIIDNFRERKDNIRKILNI